MYLPAHFDEQDTAKLHDLIRVHPLATLVTHGPDGLDANHVPLMLVAGADATGETRDMGALRGHLARANPLWRQAGAIADGIDVLAIFHGPEAYISPGWYPTKQRTGKAVPTWNYAVVHAHGRLRTIDDRDWLRDQVSALTDTHERGRPAPWQVSDAPEDYIDAMLKAIVGIEITITRLTGKWKTSQNQPEENRAGVVAGLGREAGAGARDMASLVAAFEKGKP